MIDPTPLSPRATPRAVPQPAIRSAGLAAALALIALGGCSRDSEETPETPAALARVSERAATADSAPAVELRMAELTRSSLTRRALAARADLELLALLRDGDPETATALLERRLAQERDALQAGALQLGASDRAVVDTVLTDLATAISAAPPGSTAPVDSGRTPSGLFESARIETRYRDGRVSGIALREIQGGSFWDLAGLREGDVIVAIDGESVDSSAVRARLLESLSRGTRVVLDVEGPDGGRRRVEFREAASRDG